MLGINWERYLLPRVSSLVIWSIVSHSVSDENFGVIAPGSWMLSMSIFFNLLYRRAQMKLYQRVLLFFSFFFYFSSIVTCGRKQSKVKRMCPGAPPQSREAWNLKCFQVTENALHITDNPIFIHLRYNEMPWKAFKWFWKTMSLQVLFSEVTWN